MGVSLVDRLATEDVSVDEFARICWMGEGAVVTAAD